MLIGSIATALLSGFTAFMLPGVAAVILWMNEGLKLRMYKYDWLEANPDALGIFGYSVLDQNYD